MLLDWYISVRFSTSLFPWFVGTEQFVSESSAVAFLLPYVLFFLYNTTFNFPYVFVFLHLRNCSHHFQFFSPPFISSLYISLVSSYFLLFVSTFCLPYVLLLPLPAFTYLIFPTTSFCSVSFVFRSFPSNNANFSFIPGKISFSRASPSVWQCRYLLQCLYALNSMIPSHPSVCVSPYPRVN